MFKVLENGTAPTRGTKYSCAVDLFAKEDVTIIPGETCVVGLWVAIDLDKLIESEFVNIKYEPYYQAHIDGFLSSHYLQLMLRSSLGVKGLMIPNGVEIINLDCKDEIKITIHRLITLDDLVENREDTLAQVELSGVDYEIKKGDKIAQIMMLEHKSYLFGIDTEVDGGFGSTDTNNP